MKNLLLLLILALTIIGCGGTTDENNKTEIVEIEVERPVVLSTVNIQSLDGNTFLENTSLQLKSIGVYSDGQSTDITNNVSWTSSNISVADISSSGHVVTKNIGFTYISSTYLNQTTSYKLNVISPIIVSIEVYATNGINIHVDSDTQLKAKAIFNTGSHMDITNNVIWSSSDVNVATVENNDSKGLVSGKSQGSSVISCNYGSLTTYTNINVSNHILESIQISRNQSTVYAGLPIQFTATGSYSDGSNQILTGSVLWTSNDTSVASINSLGKLTTYKEGNVSISATIGSVNLTERLEILPASIVSFELNSTNYQIPLGLTVPLESYVTLTNNTVIDQTDNTIFTVSDNTIAIVTQVDSKFMLKALKEGTITVLGSYQTFNNQKDFNITTAEIIDITLSSSFTEVQIGSTLQVTAKSTLSDGSEKFVNSDVTWTTSDESIASVDSDGKVTAYIEGSVIITATKGLITDSSNIDITKKISVVHVTNTTELIDAIQTAEHSTNDFVILLEDGNYILENTAPNYVIYQDRHSKTISLKGSSSERVSIDATRRGGFKFQGTSGSSVNIEGLSFINAGKDWSPSDAQGVITTTIRLIVKSCTFINNIGSFRSGAIDGTNVTIYSSVFDNNTSSNSLVTAEKLSIYNSVFKNRTGIMATKRYTRNYLVNTLFINNQESIVTESEIYAVNSIFISNVVNARATYNITTKVYFVNSYIKERGMQSPYELISTIDSGNLDFIDSANGDYHLQPTSILIDNGTDNYDSISAPIVDLDNNPRPSGVVTDIGPYEYQF